MSSPVIAHCMPIGGKIAPATLTSILLLDRAGLGWHTFNISGRAVDEARNLLTAEVLRSAPDATHVFWTDSDMVWTPGALRRLLALERPIVGGLCHDRRPPYKPVIARRYHESWGFEPWTLGWLFDYPPDTCIDVDATGGAFLLVEVEVFRRMRESYGNGDPAWQAWWTPIANGFAEDLSFCRRARDMGYAIGVDTGCQIGHVGEVIIDAPFAKRNRQFEYHKWFAPRETLLDAVRTEPRSLTPNVLLALDSEEAPAPPIASIVIPVYNQKPEFLRAAILSALNQTVPVEVIVVDDGNDTFPPLEFFEALAPVRFPISCTRQEWARSEAGGIVLLGQDENRGISAALNLGIQWMTTDWFQWLSSDDLFDPHKTEQQLAALLAVGRRVGFTGYNHKTDNGNGIAYVTTPSWPIREAQNLALARYCAINGSTVMIHRRVFLEVGLFNEEFKYGQDWEMWRRIGWKFDWHAMPDQLVTRREFGNLTERIAKDERLRALRDAEDRAIKAMREEDYR